MNGNLRNICLDSKSAIYITQIKMTVRLFPGSGYRVILGLGRCYSVVKPNTDDRPVMVLAIEHSKTV